MSVRFRTQVLDPMKYALVALAATLFAGTATAADAPANQRIELKNSAGAAIGTATLANAPKGVLLRIELKGVAPGWHGLHFHEKGDCSKSDFTSAGGHVHGGPTMVHGLLNPDANEAGDLPNIFVTADGSANAELIKLLARALEVRNRDVEIAVGASSRSKVVAVYGVSAAEARDRLGRARR